MKITLCSLALATSVCWGADLAPNRPLPEVSDSVVTSEPAEEGSQRVEEDAARGAARAVRNAERLERLTQDQVIRGKDDAMRHVKRAMELAQSKMAFADGEDIKENLDVRTAFDPAGFVFAGGGRTSTQPLIIRTSDLKTDTLANLQEDLTVMSRILTKTIEREVGREGRDSAMGIVISTLPGGRRPQSIYLEGYGALFLVSVKFPLVAPAAKEDEKTQKTPDTTWETTKQELYLTSDKSGGNRMWEMPAQGGGEYNAEQVESLKKELLESLKNATNLREIKPEEAVTLVVMGSRGGGGARVKHVTSRKGNQNKAEVYAVADSAHASGSESTMTLRVKKADIDAFAKGTMDFDAFKKHVSTSVY